MMTPKACVIFLLIKKTLGRVPNEKEEEENLEIYSFLALGQIFSSILHVAAPPFELDSLEKSSKNRARKLRQ